LLVTMEEEDLAHFRPVILWAVGRLAPAAPEESAAVAPAVEACLEDADPQVRGMAVWCLKKMGRDGGLAARPGLFADEGRVEIYEDGSMRSMRVRMLLDS
jgi:hypothetical protein